MVSARFFYCTIKKETKSYVLRSKYHSRFNLHCLGINYCPGPFQFLRTESPGLGHCAKMHRFQLFDYKAHSLDDRNFVGWHYNYIEMHKNLLCTFVDWYSITYVHTKDYVNSKRTMLRIGPSFCVHFFITFACFCSCQQFKSQAANYVNGSGRKKPLRVQLHLFKCSHTN
jgi:hypothetical protein